MHKEKKGVEINIFSLKDSIEQQQKYKKLLKKQNRILPFLIHPFFEEYPINFLNSIPLHFIQDLLKEEVPRKNNITAEYLEKKAYYLKLFNLLNRNIEIIALGEYAPFVAATIAMIRKIGFSGNILFYETKNSNPEPIKTEETWQSLTQALIALNFKQITIIGQTNRYTKIGKPVGCVPKFAYNLRSILPPNEKLKIVTSKIVYPSQWGKGQ